MGESSWVVQLTQDLDKSIEASRSQVSSWQKRSIYKLPECVTQLNPNAYKPHVVSFGPYHYGAPHLKPMEDHKCRALRNFIDRASAGKTSKHLISAISGVVTELKDCYDSLDPVWNDERFVKLMILDGCFMLEILRIWSESPDSNDLIFSKHGKLHILPYIRRDMLMLENQLPMLLLSKLVAFEGSKGKDNVNNLILNFFSQNEVKLPDQNEVKLPDQNKVKLPCCGLGASNLPDQNKVKLPVPEECLHVLDVYRKTLIHKGPSHKTRYPKFEMIPGSKDTIIWSATELDEAGIKFRASDSLSLKDISFSKGVLRLPMVTIDDTTESMFLNLLAFERFHVGAGNEISVYILIMNNIIDNEKDVVLLHSEGIIRSVVGCDKEVATLFNSLSRDVTVDEDCDLMLVHWSVNAYSRQPWNKWRANLVKTYFRNPWVTISVIAAIVLFAVTTIESATNFFPLKN